MNDTLAGMNTLHKTIGTLMWRVVVVEVGNGNDVGYVLLKLLGVTRRHLDRYPTSSSCVASVWFTQLAPWWRILQDTVSCLWMNGSMEKKGLWDIVVDINGHLYPNLSSCLFLSLSIHYLSIFHQLSIHPSIHPSFQLWSQNKLNSRRLLQELSRIHTKWGDTKCLNPH